MLLGILFIFIHNIFVSEFTESNLTVGGRNESFNYRIVGGADAYLGEFPYLVSIQKKIPNHKPHHYCGGSIISVKVVLTAAHCFVEDRPEYNFYAIAGIITLGHPVKVTQDRKIVHKIRHPDFDDDTVRSDILLAFVSDSFMFDSYVNKIEIGKTRPIINISVKVAGWGLTQYKSPGQKSFSNNLKHLDFKVVNQNACATSFENTWDDEIMLCAGGELEKDTCNGDSGSPLINNSVQVGIVSVGSTFCGVGAPTVFTDVSYFHDWIVETERSLSSTTCSFSIVIYYHLLLCKCMVFD